MSKKSCFKIIRIFEKRKAHSSFIDNIWCADLANMQLITTFNEGVPLFFNVLLLFPASRHGLFL